MKKNVKPLTPRCGICKRLYSSKDDDGSGLCLKCRSANSQPLVTLKRQLKQTIVMEVGKMMDDFDQEELKENETVVGEVEGSEKHTELPSNADISEVQVVITINTSELKIEDIIEPGRYGVSNSQMIPALKIAIAEKSLEKVTLLKKNYLYTFSKSLRYLKKSEREFIANNNF